MSMDVRKAVAGIYGQAVLTTEALELPNAAAIPLPHFFQAFRKLTPEQQGAVMCHVLSSRPSRRVTRGDEQFVEREFSSPERFEAAVIAGDVVDIVLANQGGVFDDDDELTFVGQSFVALAEALGAKFPAENPS